MKWASKIIFAILLASPCVLHAQDSNPISASLRREWAGISDLLSLMADKMPDQNYRFKPTPEIQDFGQRMAHVINFNMRACAQLKGDAKTVQLSAAPSRDEIMAAMKTANAECNSLFNTLTDADVLKMVPGTGRKRIELEVIVGDVLEHSQEVYGYMCLYLRLKSIVPPSSD